MTKKKYTIKSASKARLQAKAKANILIEETKKIPFFCNQCGQSCLVSSKYSHDNYGLINAGVHGGYYSPALDDETSYYFSLCEECLKLLFKGFKIAPSNKPL